ncbi:MAG: hypothetical protein ACJ77K_09365 [Bacteroidia bacterium]
MKTFLTTRLVAVLMLAMSSGLAHNVLKKDSAKVCLEVVGVAIGENSEPIDGVQVKLLKENEEMEWMEITSVSYHDHDFTFALEANSYYTIEVTKPGYVKRSVAISTHLPEKIDYSEIFKYGFEVMMFKEKKAVDDYYYDFPVALVSYNPRTEVFENNLSYTRHIKGKIKEAEAQASTGKEKSAPKK